MKSNLFKILVFILCVSMAFFVVSCKKNRGDSTPTQSESQKTSDSYISFNTLSVDGTFVYGKVSNTTTVFSFITEIKVNGNCKFVVSLDLYGVQTVATKTIPLEIGDNTVYITEIVNDEPINVYTVTIRRRPIYTVTFNANGGSQVTSQQIEEDSLANEPTTQRAGYDFAGWDYNFATPITNNITINASWRAHTNTKYKVEYYLQNLEDDNYTLDHTDELEGTTDTTADAEIKTFEHFTYNASKSTASGNINGDGSRILKVYYTRDKYLIKTNVNNTKAGTVTGSGTYKFNKQITVKATTNAGYTFNGWYNEETLITEELSYTFAVEKNVTYTAQWTANEDTKYIVEYYLQNLEDDNYTLDHTDELEGTTDTTATAEIKTFEHFTYNASKSTVSGNINGDESLVLKVYYTRNVYTLSISNSSVGNITNMGSYKYGEEGFSTTATVYLGYDFLGWYSGEELISTDLTYEFTVEKSVVAKFEVKEEMANFNFTSITTDCTITGVKDKTITEIVFPDYVTSISGGAFSGCSNLQSITLPFIGGSKTATTASSSTLFGYIFGTSSYTGSTKAIQHYSSSFYDYTTYYIPTSLTQVTITGGKILDYAFSYCDSLTSVVIGDSVTTIGSSAFEGCRSLTSVVIGDSVTTIGSEAFHYCYKLVEVINNSTHITVTKGSEENGYVGYRALSVSNRNSSYVSKLTNDNGYIVYTEGSKKIFVGYSGAETDLVIPNYITEINRHAFFDSDSLTSVVIGDSVTTIGDSAFYFCDSLTSVVIGDSVTTIGYSAFSNCKSLTSIKYKGTAEEWSAISKGRGWDTITGNYTITYNYIGE